MRYQKGFKYQLKEDFQILTGIEGYLIREDQYELLPNGMLYVMKGYAWDGASGPTRDSKCTMRGTLVHDVLYEMMRKGLLPLDHRDLCDKELRAISMGDGMGRLRAYAWYYALKTWGLAAALPENSREVLEAP